LKNRVSPILGHPFKQLRHDIAGSMVMKSIFFISILLFAHDITAQTFVHGDEDHHMDTPLITISGGHVIEGLNNMWNDAICTVSGGKIFKGFSTSVFDVLYTYENGVVYNGNSTTTFDAVYTVKNGKIFKGDSTFPMDCLYTYQDGQLYKGASSVIFDRVLWFEGDSPSTLEVVALIVAMGL